MPRDPEILYSMQKVEPLYPIAGGQSNLNFMPNLTIPRGTVLGQVSAANANEVQTIDFAGAPNVPDAGTFTLSIVGIDGGTFTTAPLAWNISNANLKIAVDALLDAAGYEGATVTVGGGPAPVDATLTFGGTAANWDMPLMVATSSLTVGGVATTVAVVATTAGNRLGLWGPYNDAVNDGREVARAIAVYDMRTDNFGRVVYTGANSPEHGIYHNSAPAWFKGSFATTDLVGLDANGIADLGRLESGTLADGVLALV